MRPYGGTVVPCPYFFLSAPRSLSAHVGEPIPPDNPKAIEDMAGYVVRNALSLKRPVYLDGQQAVIYTALKPNPALGRNFESMDPLEWLARITA